MRRILILPLCLIALACQQSQYVSRDELREMLILPSADEGCPWDIDKLVNGAFSAPQPATRAAAALATTDEKLKPLASALAAIDQAFAVSANNLANAETTAFKRTAAASEPGGAPIFRIDFEQGSLENTGRQLDVAIQGQGFFKVKTLNGYAYTRNGNFFVNKDGNIVLGMGDGYNLDPKINVPKGVTDVSISMDGKISVTKSGTIAPAIVGQVEVCQFTNPHGLKLLGGSLYASTDQSGEAIPSKPGEDGAGQFLQGFLENSNVDTTKERLRMRFLQHWRATILQAINDANGNSPSNTTTKAPRNNDPIVASVLANPTNANVYARHLSPLATALTVIEVQIDVCANNLANSKSIAFKRSRVNLEALQPQTIKSPGTTTASVEISPSGVSQGQGVKISSTQLDTEQGALEHSGRQLDIAIQGQGFFKIKVSPEVSDGTGYTRNGDLAVNKEGEIVLRSTKQILYPKITIPKGTTDISINSDGRIQVTKAGSLTPVVIGQLELCQFINPQGLNFLGQSIYTQTESSGNALQSKLGENGAGQILQGYLESSNVNPINEHLQLRALQNWRSAILSVINDSK